MTNAEKLAKDTTLMEALIYSYCDNRTCNGCSLQNIGACPFRKVPGMKVTVEEWLKQEAENDD